MLTPDRIRNLKPGPELDRAIKAALFFSGPPEWDALVASGMRPESSYSQFWPGLGLVVEEMERRGWWWRRKRSTDRFYSGFFRFNVLYEDPEPDVPGESDAHATAKAALLALAAEKRAEE